MCVPANVCWTNYNNLVTETLNKSEYMFYDLKRTYNIRLKIFY